LRVGADATIATAALALAVCTISSCHVVMFRYFFLFLVFSLLFCIFLFFAERSHFLVLFHMPCLLLLA
jgi:hypothetical protein